MSTHMSDGKPQPPPAEVDSKDKKAKEPELDGSKIHIKIFSPYKVYFDEDALSISAANDTGPFDILPRHHNFITLVSPCEILIKTLESGEKRIRISKAVMHVRNNIITVFLDV